MDEPTEHSGDEDGAAAPDSAELPAIDSWAPAKDETSADQAAAPGLVPATPPGTIPMPTVSLHGSADDFHFPALLNGLDFLNSAVESLARPGGSAPRDLKYAVLHLYTALEVLLKVRLEMHDPALVWWTPEKYNKAKHHSGDFKSCGAEHAIKRLKEHELLEAGLDPEDEELIALGQLRNRLTHFGTTGTTDAVRARTLPVLLQLMTFLRLDVLPHIEDPIQASKAEGEMGKIHIHARLLEEFVAHRKAEIADELRGHEARTVLCRSCGQHAIVLPDGPAADLTCLFCEKDYDGTGVDAAWEYVGGDRHTTLKEGGADLDACSACGESAVVGVSTAACPDSLLYICFDCGTDHDGVCDNCHTAGYLAFTGGAFDMCEDCYQISIDRF